MDSDQTPWLTERRWFVTGADGYLGNTIVRELVSRGEQVRAGTYGSLEPPSLAGVACERVPLDVTRADSVNTALLAGDPQRARRTIVVHTAGIVSVADKVDPLLWATNVEGTQNVIEACRAAGVARLVYISSVHAIPEPRIGSMCEVDSFDPDLVEGAYPRTKAEASRRVLAAGDLDRVIVQPTGLLGPGDFGDAPLTRLIRDLTEGRVPALIAGGYDFVDVRDAAGGTIAAAERGRSGECYLLGAGRLTLAEIARVVAEETGCRVPPVLPVWVARLMVPLAALDSRRRSARPIFTRRSLNITGHNTEVCHDKATAELGFEPRPLHESILDTVRWVQAHSQGRTQR